LKKEVNKENNLIIHNGDKFFPMRYKYEGYPHITGLPEITWQEYTLHVRKNKLARKQLTIGVSKTPKECALRGVVNYPIRRYGGLQIGINGTYGSGKSNLLNLVEALLMAGKHRIIQWDDAVCECRSLSAHGYYDKHDIFHPFELYIWIPKGYQFDETSRAHNPLWENRHNVYKKEYSHPKEIVPNLLPHKMNVIYSDALDPESNLRLWIDLMNMIKKEVSINKSYIFAMHEFADMFPEGAPGEMYRLIEEAKTIVKRLRKDRIGIATSFHENADISYKVVRKFNYLFQKRPVNKKDMSPLEKHARAFGRSDVNISSGGYWRHHVIGKYPELLDKYRLIPGDKYYVYKNEELCEQDDELPEVTKKITAKQMAGLYNDWLNHLSERDSAKRNEVTRHVVRTIRKEFEETAL